MKKLAIGCLIVVAVLGIVVAVGGYVAYQRFVKPMAGSFQQLAELPELDKQVANTASFRAPDTGELSEAMVARFVKVQEQVQGKLGSRMAELKVKFEELDRGMKAENRQANFTEAMTALKDLSSLLLEAKRAQVQALNDAGFSLREYTWVRNQVYAAVGMVAGEFDIATWARQAERGRSEAPADPQDIGEVPERNKSLVAPYREKLEQWAPLAFFGL